MPALCVRACMVALGGPQSKQSHSTSREGRVGGHSQLHASDSRREAREGEAHLRLGCAKREHYRLCRALPCMHARTNQTNLSAFLAGTWCPRTLCGGDTLGAITEPGIASTRAHLSDDRGSPPTAIDPLLASFLATTSRRKCRWRNPAKSVATKRGWDGAEQEE